MTTKFREAETVKFLELYRNESCLWDAGNKEYKDSVKRRDALERIVLEMGIPNFTIADCRNKIKNIRSHYCQEVKKIKISMKRGSGNVYKPSLVWFDLADGFLRECVQQCKELMATKLKRKRAETDIVLKTESDFISEDSLTVTDFFVSNDISELENDDNANFENVHQSTDTLRTDSDRESNASFRSVLPPPLKRSYKKTQGDVVAAVFDKLESISQRQDASKTEFDVFGSSVAAQLNSMAWENAIELQLQIQQLITQYRLSKKNIPFQLSTFQILPAATTATQPPHQIFLADAPSSSMFSMENDTGNSSSNTHNVSEDVQDTNGQEMEAI